MSKNRNNQSTQPRKDTAVADQEQQSGSSDQDISVTLTPPAVDSGSQEVLESVTREGDAITANFVANEAAPASELVEHKATEQPAAEPEPAPVAAVSSNDVKQLPVFPASAYELPLGASGPAKMTILELKDYIEKMSSKVRMDHDTGGQIQGMLYHILIQAINTKAEEFDMVFGMVMKLIRDNMGPKGVFADENIHRFTPHVTLPSASAQHLRYLVNVLTALADPTALVRAAAKRQINIEQALSGKQIKEEARQRVLAYFNY
jgi:hypothetical protein